MDTYTGHYGIVIVSSCYNECTCRENGIKYRHDEAVGGWFSQIGEMHQVHHLWGKPIATYYNILSSSTILLCTYIIIIIVTIIQLIRTFQTGLRQGGQPGNSLDGMSASSGQVSRNRINPF